MFVQSKLKITSLAAISFKNITFYNLNICNNSIARIQVTEVEFGNDDCSGGGGQQQQQPIPDGPSGRSNVAPITLKDLAPATRRPLTAKKRSSADQRTHARKPRFLGVLSVRLGASARFHILSFSIHSTASLRPKIIKWMDFLLPHEIWHEKLHRDNQPKLKTS